MNINAVAIIMMNTTITVMRMMRTVLMMRWRVKVVMLGITRKKRRTTMRTLTTIDYEDEEDE